MFTDKWKQIFDYFVKQPEFTRACQCPGNEKVFIGKKQWVPKYLLLSSKTSIIEQFLEKCTDENGDRCPFKRTFLFQYFPEDCRIPTQRDLGRNVCPFHSNLRRDLTALQANGLLKEVVCRATIVASKLICSKPGVDLSDPKSWDENCCLVSVLHVLI